LDQPVGHRVPGHRAAGAARPPALPRGRPAAGRGRVRGPAVPDLLAQLPALDVPGVRPRPAAAVAAAEGHLALPRHTQRDAPVLQQVVDLAVAVQADLVLLQQPAGLDARHHRDRQPRAVVGLGAGVDLGAGQRAARAAPAVRAGGSGADRGGPGRVRVGAAPARSDDRGGGGAARGGGAAGGGLQVREARALFSGAGFFALYLPWGISPRTLNYSHYLFEAIPYACLSLGLLLDRMWERPVGRALAIAYVALVIALFVLFFPFLTAVQVPQEWFNERFLGVIRPWTWFPSWI